MWLYFGGTPYGEKMTRCKAAFCAPTLKLKRKRYERIVTAFKFDVYTKRSNGMLNLIYF
ncbi:MAG: hypothetical protein ACHQF0_00460 [Chitinophagales bacterium]